MAKKKKTLVIIDGNALVHRAWHALPPLTDPEGNVVSGVYGFTSVLLKMINEQNPEYIVATFDKPGKTFRHEEYVEYKATRVKAPDELYEQIPMIKDLLKVFDIPVFEASGYEADDVIGTISKKLDPKKDVESIIVSGDMDLLQLVDDNTKVLGFIKGLSQTKLYDEDAIKEKYGLKAKELIDFKAIKGDPSDNISGVSGIGDKGARDLIQTYGGLDNIYKEVKTHPNKFSKSTLKKLQDGKDDAKLSKKLVTIITTVPIKFSLEKCKVGTWNRDMLVKAFAEFGFKSLVAKLPGGPSKETDKKKRNKAVVLSTLKDIRTYLNSIKDIKELAFSIEMEDAGLFGDSLVGIAVASRDGAVFIDFKNFTKTDLKQFLGQVKPIFDDKAIKKISYDLKQQLELLDKYGIKAKGLDFDVMIASYLLASGTRTHDLKAIVLQELGKDMGEGGDDFYLNKISYILELKNILAPRLDEVGITKLFNDIEMPLIPVLADMEKNGVKIDAGYLKQMAKQVDADLDKISKKIYKLGGEEFNINSPQQLQVILFEKLELPTEGIRRGKTGISTAAPELEKLRDTHPIINLIFAQRELAKLKSTYIDALPTLINKQTGRVHTNFNQVVTATGRLSSSNPNLQNIPIRSKLGREIRKAFIAPSGSTLITADYSQIELRIVASISGDKKMIKAFQDGRDIHTATAAAIWGIPESKVDKDMRRAAKAINFGIIYGQGPHGLAASADISFMEAKDFIDKYLQAYSGIRNYMDETKALAQKLGYAETIFGRRRYLPDIQSGIRQVRAAAERMAINMPVQGTAADIMKLAMINVYNNLPKISKKSKIILQVHDELVFEVPKADEIKVASFVREEMENAYKLKVPIVVDVETGKNWGAMKRINS